MSIISENPRISDVLVFEEGIEVAYIRDVVTVASGTPASALGQVLAKYVASGTASETHEGNTGNGAMTLDAAPVLANAQAGIYTVECSTAATDGGTFTVYDPNGSELGSYVVGAPAFENQVKFIIADGSVDFNVGDKFLVTVGGITYKYKQVTPAANDGSQVACAVALAAVDASGGDTTVLAVTRGPAVVKQSGLVWTAGMTADQENTALAQLLTLGIKSEAGYGV